MKQIVVAVAASLLLVGCFEPEGETMLAIERENTKQIELQTQSQREQREFETQKYLAMIELCKESLKLSHGPGRNSSCNIK